MNKKRKFVLNNIEGEGSVEVAVEGNGLAMLVRPAGFGDNASADGHGSPILIENRNGVPFLVVWADINQEDPTHVIDLSKASEKARVDE